MKRRKWEACAFGLWKETLRVDMTVLTSFKKHEAI